MTLDRDLIVFHGKVITVAQDKFMGSCSGREGEPFVDGLYKEYVAAGRPATPEDWLGKRLQGEFKCVDQPPRWVEDEPSWPFHGRKPMVFICQTSLPENETTRDSLTWDTEVYLFGSRVPGCGNDSYGIEFRAVMQHGGFGGTGM